MKVAFLCIAGQIWATQPSDEKLYCLDLVDSGWYDLVKWGKEKM